MKKEEKPAKKKTKPTGGKQKAKKLDVLSLKVHFKKKIP